jgi:hypothetical protein
MGLLPDWTPKDVTDLVKKGATIEAQEKILALREAALMLQEENLKLKDRIKDLEDELSVKENLVFEEKCYWLFKDGEQKDGPFCQICKDKDNKLIRMQVRQQGNFWKCYVCKTAFRTPK